jgi:hypothetical protein
MAPALTIVLSDCLDEGQEATPASQGQEEETEVEPPHHTRGGGGGSIQPLTPPGAQHSISSPAPVRSCLVNITSASIFLLN